MCRGLGTVVVQRGERDDPGWIDSRNNRLKALLKSLFVAFVCRVGEKFSSMVVVHQEDIDPPNLPHQGTDRPRRKVTVIEIQDGHPPHANDEHVIDAGGGVSCDLAAVRQTHRLAPIETVNLREASPLKRPAHIEIQRHTGKRTDVGGMLRDSLESRQVQMIAMEMRSPQVNAVTGLLKGNRVEIAEAPSPEKTCSVKPAITQQRDLIILKNDGGMIQ
jgi:hypothetical protein